MSHRFPSRAVCFGLLVFSALSLARAEDRVSDYLKLPPVMAKQVGNPVVSVKPGNTTSFRKRGASRDSYVLRVPEADISKGNIRRILATELLQHFYRRNFSNLALSRNERRLKVKEIIPMDQEIFLKIGMNRLLGTQSPGRILETWWKVRMGFPLKKSQTHQLMVTNLHWQRAPGKKTTLGHFCFAIRKRGGDPDGDTMFDFRAPWPHQRRARVTEAINIRNRLKLEIMTFNLYDWFYTQTEYRNCYVNAWFVPIYEEQLVLLRNFATRSEYHGSGNFRVGKKNCASLGAHFLDRILPIGEGMEERNGLYDYPIQTGQIVVKRFAGNGHFIKVTNITRKLREPTSKSELQPASPNRRESKPFRFLLKDPAIN